MSDDLLGHYDCAVIGTGLSESILAAALAKAGRTVVHLDEDAYYGASDASLSLHELIEWADAQSSASYTFADAPAELLQVSQQYALSLAPSIIPAIGEFIDALVKAGVSRYTGFRLLDAVALCDSEGRLKRVPASKEDVFKDRALSLPDKRRLMKFLLFATGDFDSSDALAGHEDDPVERFLSSQMGLSNDLLRAVMYAVSLCSSPADRTLPTLHRLRSYLRSTGRYGNSPFLVGQYGGAGELAQGFCRVCAVFGGTYVLGRKLDSTEKRDGAFRIKLGDKQCSADQLIVSSSASTAIHRAIAIIDAPIELDIAVVREGEEGVEPPIEKHAASALFVFPPSTFTGQKAAIQVLMVGEAVYACPAGQYVLYLSTPASDSIEAKSALQPALDALVKSPRLLFSLFYTETSSPAPPACDGRLLVDRQSSSNMADLPAGAVTEAHRLFKLIVGEDRDLFSSLEAPCEDE